MIRQELFDQIVIIEAVKGDYVAASLRPPVAAHWRYEYVIQVGSEDYRFHVTVDETVSESERDKNAKSQFKEIVALIAKKVAVS